MEYKHTTELDTHLLTQFPGANPSPVMLVDDSGQILYCNPSGQILCREKQMTELSFKEQEYQKLTWDILNLSLKKPAPWTFLLEKSTIEYTLPTRTAPD